MPAASRRFLAACAIFVAVFLAAVIRNRPPAPKPVSAPADQFSAERAALILRDLVGDGRPHPVMSTANREVRDRIVARLSALGYQPEIQKRFACREYVSCATVENIIAIHPGTTSGKSVMLAVHYDSVPAGPGASDDGVGVAAALEIARIVRGEKHRNPIIFLIDDGEEAGLLGAEAFLEHPLAKKVGAVINLEARGTEGTSFMFETSEHNRWLVSQMRHAVPRPATSSLYYSIYKRLPNDTDFTVFKEGNLAGLNFGFIGGATRYHTPLDDFAHASRGSMQHHGDNALALIRRLANADLTKLPAEEAVYFDVLNFAIVSWPKGATWGLIAAAAILIAFAIRRLDLRVSSLLFGFIGWLGSCVVALIVGLALAMLLRRSGAFPSQWVAYPEAAVALFWILGVAAALLLAAAVGSRAKFEGLWAGSAIGWLALSIVSAILLPGAVYLFLPVALTFALPRAVAPAAFVAALIVIPTLLPMYHAMGLTLLPIVSFMIATLFAIPASLLPELSVKVRRVALSLAAASFVIALGIALTRTPYSAENPRRLNIAYRVDADRAGRQWVIGAEQPLPPSLERAASWTREVDRLSGSERFVANAKGPSVPIPSVAIMSETPEGNGRRVTIAVRRGGGARVNLTLEALDRIESLRINGLAIGTPIARKQRDLGPLRIALRFDDDRDAIVELQMRDREPIVGSVEELSFGLPSEGEFLLRARPAWAVPSQNGDTTIVTKRIEI